MNDDRFARLEEKLAWLQRHVTEQDKAMLEMAEEIDRLKRQLAEWREKSAVGSAERATAALLTAVTEPRRQNVAVTSSSTPGVRVNNPRGDWILSFL